MHLYYEVWAFGVVQYSQVSRRSGTPLQVVTGVMVLECGGGAQVLKEGTRAWRHRSGPVSELEVCTIEV